jgi:hypothetical protein
MTYNGNLNLKRTNVNHEWTADQLKEYKKCQKSAKYFIETYVKIIHVDHGWVNFNLRPFQNRMLKSIVENRFTICKVPRQQGKSILVVGMLLWYILFHENCAVALLAQKGEQAQDLLSRLQLSYEAVPHWMQQGIKEWNKRSIILENGSKIVASSTSSGSIRGKSQNIIYLDEFAHIPAHIQEEFFTSVYPTISSGESTKLIITSTPRGLDMFYKIWVDSENGRNSYNRVEAHWSEIPGRDEKWKQETIKNTSERQFKQEFEVEFLGSSDTLIDGSTLRRLAHNDPISLSAHLKVYNKPEQGKPYVVTVDVAEGTNHDCSAFIVFDMSSIPYTVAAVYKNNLISPLVFPHIIEEVAKRYNEAYVLVETNNIGQQVADILFRDIEYEYVLMTAPSGKNGIQISTGFGSGAKVGVKTTKQTKRIGCSNLKSLVENDKLLVNDFDIIYELSRFTLQAGSYKAEGDGYDDLAMCCVMFGWFQQQQFAKDLTNTDLRANLYNSNADSIESDLIPVGEYNSGKDTRETDLVVDLVNDDFDKWFRDDVPA